jgi:hypothetical protein
MCIKFIIAEFIGNLQPNKNKASLAERQAESIYQGGYLVF